MPVYDLLHQRVLEEGIERNHDSPLVLAPAQLDGMPWACGNPAPAWALHHFANLPGLAPCSALVVAGLSIEFQVIPAPDKEQPASLLAINWARVAARDVPRAARDNLRRAPGRTVVRAPLHDQVDLPCVAAALSPLDESEHLRTANAHKRRYAVDIVSVLVILEHRPRRYAHGNGQRGWLDWWFFCAQAHAEVAPWPLPHREKPEVEILAVHAAWDVHVLAQVAHAGRLPLLHESAITAWVGLAQRLAGIHGQLPRGRVSARDAGSTLAVETIQAPMELPLRNRTTHENC
mmetsp:Transcript_71177/g.201908  ORF Transcript_71177/g.201908 Transcript_71177/m.201908 type:complete len:290 (-) Transcript_71177:116-985(-)